MSIEFSTAICALRREKGVSQKDAASALGISQALLSHYEKGIRECNLSFVKKAAEYYNVTADYLLGLSPSRHGSGAVFGYYGDDKESSVLGIETILKCIMYISGITEEESRKSSDNFIEYLCLSLGKYIALKEKSDEKTPLLCDYAQNSAALKTMPFLKEEPHPEFVKIVTQMANEFISHELS